MFFTVPPCRVFDSRAGHPLAAGFSLLQVAGLCGIPADARAFSANLTIVGPQVAGYLTIYAGDTVLPFTPTINFNPGQIRANNAMVQLAGDGSGTVAAYFAAAGPGTATVDLVVDVNGYFADPKLKRGPVLVSVGPPAGGQYGGTLVTVRGNFPDPASTQVQFNQQASPPATGSTRSMLTVTTPPFSGIFPTGPCAEAGGPLGTINLPARVDVTVTDEVTGCSTTLNGAFSYLPADASCHLPPPTPPVAAFTVLTSNANDVAIFTDTSTGFPTAWLWNFGDTQTTTVQYPVHDYMAPGSYLATLTACNPAGCSTTSQLVSVPGP
jgi:PKD repeat protein